MNAMSHEMTSWVQQISEAWQASLHSILRVGQLLISAKKALPHGSFQQMVRSELPFGPNTARRLMAVARNKNIIGAKNRGVLPPHWATLYELTKLPDEAFAQGVAGGLIHSSMERREVKSLLASRRAERESQRAEEGFVLSIRLEFDSRDTSYGAARQILREAETYYQFMKRLVEHGVPSDSASPLGETYSTADFEKFLRGAS